MGQRRGGLIAAYLLVLGLIAASAAFVFGVEGETPRIADQAAAAVPRHDRFAGAAAQGRAAGARSAGARPTRIPAPQAGTLPRLCAGRARRNDRGHRGRPAAAPRLTIGLDAVDRLCQALRSRRSARARRRADDQSRRQREADAARHRRTAGRGEPGLPGRHARPAALAARGAPARPRGLSHAARRGSQRPGGAWPAADPGIGRADGEPASPARRDGPRRGLCRLGHRLGRPGLAVRSRPCGPS